MSKPPRLATLPTLAPRYRACLAAAALGGFVVLGALLIACSGGGEPFAAAEEAAGGSEDGVAGREERGGTLEPGSPPAAERNEGTAEEGGSAGRSGGREPAVTAPGGEMGERGPTGSSEPAQDAGAPAADGAAPPPPPPAAGPDGIARLRIPAAGVAAPVVTGYVDASTNLMIAPDSPSAVAWYQYTPLPGAGGNAVFAGHVDYVNYGPAVFWNLRDLAPGDRIEVDLAGGRTLTYEVQFNQVYSASSGPWQELFHPYAGDDVLTLYTCDGSFSGGEYSDRRVVRAARVY